MASIKDLKKDINFVLGDIIEHVYLWETNSNNGKTSDKSEALIDNTITVFDDLMVKVNKNKIENKKVYFSGIREELETEAKKLIEDLNQLS